ncbi:alpha/beta fold hydrolase [Polymorphobacter arshaanensis]|uniref:Alpha/beta fold hydrolase n=1 Tax=Glacieibacterium arshaanense TaxID=2511025 RepID=A0A4Y9ER83_9SPHN|nr:alpha/beta fold hydrolase [Polymorphobacter arshaanensis]TFU06125.1 alpha/beta fold hydrolase [Polymorphobacter arshaanensis]
MNIPSRTRLAAFALIAATLAAPASSAEWPVKPGDFTVRDFSFGSGEKLPELRQHYITLGTPHRGKDGQIDNAVMVLHGTGGTGAQFLRPQFADELYGPGQPLDITKYFIILPDAIGHGGSSKPSDGLRMNFPKYDYADMVAAQHRLLTEHFGIKRLRLLMGTSMGCMMDFVWGTTYPGVARAIMPTACLPVELAGRNRMWRMMSIDAIKADPVWANGTYTTQPVMGLRTASSLSLIAGSAPVRQQADYPTRAAAEKALEGQVEASIAASDANDVIYRLDASRNYNPAPLLGRITVPVTWINSADDFINPPGLDIAPREAAKMPNAKFILIPETAEGRGHSTHTWAKFWKADLVELLKRSE